MPQTPNSPDPPENAGQAGIQGPPLPCPVIPDHELIKQVGQGAYGQVWLARNILGTFRAAKVIYRHVFAEDRPYEREFEGIQKFEPISRSHPGLVAILHIGRNDAGKCFYYVMEAADDHLAGTQFDPVRYVPRTLRSLLAEAKRIPAAECLPIGISLAAALEHLHQNGLVHRDVKPSNVIFVRGAPKLADIGLVTWIGEKATNVGTEGYIPPEGAGSPEADVFSLGKVLYELVTGLGHSRFPSLPTRLEEFSDAPLVARLNDIVLRACDPSPRRRFRSAGDLHAALLELTPGSTPARTRPQRPPPAEKSVAVLPFLNMSPDPENEYLSDGITEDLTVALAKVKGLKVAGRTSAFAFKGKAKDIRKIAEQLSVRTIVEGSVRKSGRNLRISVQLINAADGCHLWSERYDRAMKDVFALQDEISRAIVATLKVQLAGERQAPLARCQTESTQAYQLYLQGRFYWNLRGQNLRKAMHYFELALLEDPGYALAYAGIADSYNLLGFYGHLAPKEAYPKAKAAAVQAVQLDEKLADAHNSLGFSDLMYDWDKGKALEEFRKALEIDPTYAPALYWRASYLSAAGKHEEAIAEDLRALEIDPLSAVVRAHLGWTYLHARDYANAMRYLRAALEVDNGFMLPHWALGRVCLSQGLFEEALAEFEQLLPHPPLNTWGLAWLGATYAAMGQPGRTEEILRQLEELSKTAYVRSYWFALLHQALGRTDQAFAWLNRCIEERDAWVGWIRCDPGFDQLQSDPRFQEIRRQTGLD